MFIRVAVIESNPLRRLGLVAALQEDDRLRVWGVGVDARSALTGRSERPMVVVLGSHENHTGVSPLADALKQVRLYYPRGPVVVLSPEPVTAGQSRASWNGRLSPASLGNEVVLLDHDSSPDLLRHTVLQTAIFFDPVGVRETMSGVGWRPRISLGAESLSPREWDVLRLLALRWEAKEIAEALNISHSTVRSHLRSIYAKLGVRNRRQAILEALRILRQLELDGRSYDGERPGKEAENGRPPEEE